MAEKRWIAETLFDDLGFRMTFQVEKVLYEMQTEHQHLVLFEQPFFGKMLMLDGATQISKRDEFIYQEMMSHVPLFAHGNARDVLIIGGGDCGIAEEVLKHKTVKRLTQVEIDPKVVEFAKEHFPEFTGPVFADKRFESIIDDGAKYVAKTDRRYDVIIVDSTDPHRAGKNPVRREVLCRLQALFEKRRRADDAKRRAVLPEERADLDHEEIPAAVRGRHLLRRRNPDLCRRPHGHGFCDRRQAAAAAQRKTIAQRYRKAGGFRNEILDARGPGRRFRPAALYRRSGGQGGDSRGAGPSSLLTIAGANTIVNGAGHAPSYLNCDP